MAIDKKILAKMLEQRPELMLPVAMHTLVRILTRVQRLSQRTGDFVLARTKVMDQLCIEGQMRDVFQSAIGSYFENIAFIVKRRRTKGTMPPKDRTRPPLDVAEKRRRRKRVRVEQAGQMAWTFSQPPEKSKRQP